MPESSRYNAIVSILLPSDPVQFSVQGSLLKMTMKNPKPMCEACFLDGKKICTAKHKDENGNCNKLCALHAHQTKTHVNLNPCRGCPSTNAMQASFPDETGKKAQYCGKHAREQNTYVLRCGCVDCPDEKKITANYSDEFGNQRRYCYNHAIKKRCYKKQLICRDCPKSNGVTPSFPDEFGKAAVLCYIHAKIVGTYRKRFECIKCLPNESVWASYDDIDGNKNRLCVEHAKEAGTHFVRNPCVLCPIEKKHQALFPSVDGKKNQVCSIHAQQIGSHYLLRPCRDCKEGEKIGAAFKDEFGKSYRLCFLHAMIAGTHEIRLPCRIEGCKKASIYPENGSKHLTLCTGHAKKEGVWFLRRKCELCPKTGHFPNVEGELDKLCAPCARKIGTHFIKHVCEMCDMSNPIGASFRDDKGKLRYCASHAYELGIISRPVHGCSRIACEIWDKLEMELGIKLQHSHYENDGIVYRNEFRIPMTRYSVDAFDITTQTVYEFLGVHVHGYPKYDVHFYEISKFRKVLNSTLYFETMDRMKIIYSLGYKVKYFWSHEYEKIRKKYISVQTVMHNLEDEEE